MSHISSGQELFLRGMQELGVDVSRETSDQLEALVSTLVRWQKAINLVGRTTMEDVWTRHVLDSAQLKPLIPPDAATLAAYLVIIPVIRLEDAFEKVGGRLKACSEGDIPCRRVGRHGRSGLRQTGRTTESTERHGEKQNPHIDRINRIFRMNRISFQCLSSRFDTLRIGSKKNPVHPENPVNPVNSSPWFIVTAVP
jgi:hypothetical protein